MQGFFSHDQLTKSPGCRYTCKLYQSCITSKMPPTGQGLKKILVVAEAPGKNEDQRGIQLVGSAGTLLRRSLIQLGIDLDKDCRKTNSVCCRPPKNRTPTSKEIDACRPLLWKEINEFKPHLIILLGRIAVVSFMGDRLTDIDEMAKWRGQVWPDRKAGCWVGATFHPSYVMREEKDQSIQLTFDNDLEHILAYQKVPFPVFTPEEDKIEIGTNERDVIANLKKLVQVQTPALFAFDYEATGKKPHRKEHKIVCASFSMDPNHGYSFFMEGKLIRELWIQVLRNKFLKKMAHNLKYEEAWSRVKMRTPVFAWFWDSMLAAHVLDNRRKTTSLKFQSIINFGIYGYESEIKPFLEQPLNKKEAKMGANALNKISLCPRKKLLIYNGLDSMLEYRLAVTQMEKMGVTL